jgi:D-methionine transport system ATP-binding protein
MSGAGKSTLVRCLNYLERPTSGEVIIGGRDLGTLTEKELREQRSDIAMIFQHFNLLMQKSVLDNVCFPLFIQGKSKSEAKKKAYELLDIVGLKDRAKAYPSQLSGGQKQRLCIARALLKKPKILILDDSTSAVDTKTDAMIRSGFKEFIPETTKIIIAQRISSVQEADHIIVMDGGKIQAVGNHEELMKTSPIYREVYESQNKGGGQDEE